MHARSLFLWALLVSWAAGAAPLEARPEAVAEVLQSMRAPNATEGPELYRAEDGFVRFLGAPPGGYFDTGAAASKANVEDAAKGFVTTYAEAFGILSPEVRLQSAGVQSSGDRNFVRFDQHYGNLPVFGAQIVVHAGPDRNVLSVMSDILRDTRTLDDGSLSQQPGIDAQQAGEWARIGLAEVLDNLEVEELRVSGEPALLIFAPDVLGLDGPTRLAWKLSVVSVPRLEALEEVFVDAQSGQLLLHYSLIKRARDRAVYDGLNSESILDRLLLAALLEQPLDFGTPVRIEGGSPSGIADVDNAYDYLGDTYDFFFNHHDRDGFDDKGSKQRAVVRFGAFPDAFWIDEPFPTISKTAINALFLGPGLAADDVVSHELTHGVTFYSSELIYFGFSGAINESFSDIWGEFVDLTNGRGNDSPGVRWWMGEDVPAGTFGDFGPGIPGGAIRYMRDPTVFGDPDRLGSPYLADVNSAFDNGGVHINSGIGNKLCYLLTDGGTFNGESVAPLAPEAQRIGLVADLFYEAQLNLTASADYFDLYFALAEACKTYNLNFDQRLSVAAAARAVEIIPQNIVEDGLRHARAVATKTRGGDEELVIALTWTNPPSTQFEDVIVMRGYEDHPRNPGEGQEVFRGRANAFVDHNVLDGVEYFYTVFAELTDGLVQVAYARAVAGAEPPTVFAEAFGEAGGGLFSPVDLAFSQITFAPTAGPVAGPGEEYVGLFTEYTATITRNVYGLPVPRNDADGGAVQLPLTDNGGVSFSASFPFPFFGRLYNQIYVGANGYVSFTPVAPDDPDNFPTLSAHFDVPRISYLFADFATTATGEMWARDLPDRLVLTRENVSEVLAIPPFYAVPRSTVQLEIFYSGHIRITYLSVGAENAIVGLSDGRGNPRDLRELPELEPYVGHADLSELPAGPAHLSIDPVSLILVREGGTAAFDVTTSYPPENVPPILSANLFRLAGGVYLPVNAPVPFADHGDGTGHFQWQTGMQDSGNYVLRVEARQDQEAHVAQDVRIFVGSVRRAPVAENLQILTDTPGEHGDRTRNVPTEAPLRASYAYAHPDHIVEGQTLLHWFRNGLMVPYLAGVDVVQPELTQSGDQWSFQVIPVDAGGMRGETAVSPVVTIDGRPIISAITPPLGPTSGGQTVVLHGQRLRHLINVYFGGLPAKSIRVLSDLEIEAVTPTRRAGLVDVTVETAAGRTSFDNGYRFVDSGTSSMTFEDVNNDGRVDATDIQLVINAILGLVQTKDGVNPDVNRDGKVNSSDVQAVVNRALLR